MLAITIVACVNVVASSVLAESAEKNDLYLLQTSAAKKFQITEDPADEDSALCDAATSVLSEQDLLIKELRETLRAHRRDQRKKSRDPKVKKCLAKDDSTAPGLTGNGHCGPKSAQMSHPRMPLLTTVLSLKSGLVGKEWAAGEFFTPEEELQRWIKAEGGEGAIIGRSNGYLSEVPDITTAKGCEKYCESIGPYPYDPRGCGGYIYAPEGGGPYGDYTSGKRFGRCRLLTVEQHFPEVEYLPPYPQSFCRLNWMSEGVHCPSGSTKTGGLGWKMHGLYMGDVKNLKKMSDCKDACEKENGCKAFMTAPVNGLHPDQRVNGNVHCELSGDPLGVPADTPPNNPYYTWAAWCTLDDHLPDEYNK